MIWLEPMLICKDAVAVWAGEDESVTRTLKLSLLAVVGIPVIDPEEFRTNPAGNVPEEITHLYGPVPPLADKLAA